MENITRDGNVTSKSSAGVNEFLSALNILLSFTASLGNVLILIALHKVSSIHPPTKLFFRCLAVTDLCVGLLVQPLFATVQLSRITGMSKSNFFYIDEVSRVTNWILCTVSVLTLTAISVDRLLALLLGLRYKHVVTLRRVRVAIFCFWFIGASVGSTRKWRTNTTLVLASIFLTLSLVTSIFCYTRIHLKITTSANPTTKQLPPTTSKRRRDSTEHGKI